MSDKLRAAALAALNWLEGIKTQSVGEYMQVVDSLKTALAEPKQEPVGKFSKFSDGVWKEVTASSPGQFLYTAPPRKEWVGLAEPKQEPVAWKHPNKNMVFWEDTKEVDEYHGFKPTIPLYTAPPRKEWVGLTDEEISTVDWKSNETLHDFSRAIEAKLKEKNT